MFIREQKKQDSGCLGQMTQKYRKYCSEECPNSALCVLVLMGEYLRQDGNPSDQKAQNVRIMPLPPLIIPPEKSA